MRSWWVELALALILQRPSHHHLGPLPHGVVHQGLRSAPARHAHPRSPRARERAPWRIHAPWAPRRPGTFGDPSGQSLPAVQFCAGLSVRGDGIAPGWRRRTGVLATSSGQLARFSRGLQDLLPMPVLPTKKTVLGLAFTRTVHSWRTVDDLDGSCSPNLVQRSVDDPLVVLRGPRGGSR